MKALTLITLGAVALATAGTAAAQATRAPAPAMALKPFYVGGSVGWSKFDLNTSDFPPGGDVQFTALPGVPVSESRDENGTGWQAFAGWRFNRYFSVEGGYTDLGNAKVQYSAAGAVANVEYEDQVWTALGMATLPLDYGLSIFGQAGAGYHNTKTQVSGSVTGIPLSDGATSNRWAFVWGLGAGWDINQTFGLRFQYQNFGTAGDSNNTGRSGTSLVSGSAIVRF